MNNSTLGVGTSTYKNLQVVKNDDLCIILGINKAIAFLLNQEKITTFEDLSRSNPEHLSTIIHKGMTTHINTWVHQAVLAKKRKWKALSVYQYHILLKTAGIQAYEES